MKNKREELVLPFWSNVYRQQSSQFPSERWLEAVQTLREPLGVPLQHIPAVIGSHFHEHLL